MSNEYIDVVGRAVARASGKYVLARATRSIADDPRRAFGIAPIRIVSEQRVQGVAFGMVDAPPTVVTTWHPMSRSADFLRSFGDALRAYLLDAAKLGFVPRIWLPHAAALEVIDLLGHRYAQNRSADEWLRNLGSDCALIADEAEFPGQQVVAIVTQLLTTHALTGQAPVEDFHLGALLAWFERPIPQTPWRLADQRSLAPAAAMLVRNDDDLVEKLRRPAKAGSRSAQNRIEGIVRASAVAEWDLMQRGRAAFWTLPLAPSAGIATLVDASRDRMLHRIGSEFRRRSTPHALSRHLEHREHAVSVVEDVDFCNDPLVRERALRAGRAFAADVVGVVQPNQGRHPCTLMLAVSQPVLRIRPGAKIKTVNGALEGRVDGVTRSRGQRRLAVTLSKGVRRSTRPAVGSRTTWVDTVLFPPYLTDKALRLMEDAQAEIVYADALPPSTPRVQVPADVVARIERLRGRA